MYWRVGVGLEVPRKSLFIESTRAFSTVSWTRGFAFLVEGGVMSQLVSCKITPSPKLRHCPNVTFHGHFAAVQKAPRKGRLPGTAVTTSRDVKENAPLSKSPLHCVYRVFE